ncbi:MAG: PspC domain-containing protein [Tissierellaceae bacterium]|nr:PspC domain-containing protein [Tissierellaceae bacterium]
MDRRLYRSETNKMIAGVCGGLGEYFNIDPTLIRLAWVILSIPTALFGGLIAYVIAAIIIPYR